MPSGKVHLRVETLLLVVGWLPLMGWLLAVGAIESGDAVAFVFAYAFSMLYLSPDLDLSSSRPTLRWGVLRWLWVPYAAAFKHRNLSHHLLLGPLTRIAYLGILVFGGMAVYVAIARRAMPDLQLPLRVLLALLCGFYIPNLTHVLLDRWQTARRSRRRL
jgi:uncharacterized metal-binding protein